MMSFSSSNVVQPQRGAWWQVVLLSPFLFPALWRLSQDKWTSLAGALSDVAVGLIFFFLAQRSPRWLRLILLVLWVMLVLMAHELFAAMRRLPSWQDLMYLTDPEFVQNSVSGFHFSAPAYAGILLFFALIAAATPARRLSGRAAWSVPLTAILLLIIHGVTPPAANSTVASRYNPLHWLVNDACSSIWPFGKRATTDSLPASLTSFDLHGTSVLPQHRTPARNVLLITLEGISGIYIPEIRSSMNVAQTTLQMEGLARETADAMLVPDFVTHSHQTIRGLYAIHCGDFSKFSYSTPKAYEIQGNAQRAGQCLPAQLASHGWQTHYLQGAPLQFMNKDKVMPAIGFRETHGLEWFPESPNDPFVWGTTDDEFFTGAREYVRRLQKGGKPWMLSLLTVATHQPYAAPDDLAKKYGSRKLAAVALLDEAITAFLNDLRNEGVLDDTLVVITSDESHGAEGADWYGSWGFAVVIAPEKGLPRVKPGSHGLVDVEISILDYLGLPIPPDIRGRSLFRTYDRGRDMVAYTGGHLRWQTADGNLYECSRDLTCRLSQQTGIIGPRPPNPAPVDSHKGAELFAMAELLDNSLFDNRASRVMQFANGEIRKLPRKISSEWADNLIGAQYLGFPKDSRVDVEIDLKALDVQEAGVRLKLVLRQFEKEVGGITLPEFPLLRSGEECRVAFSFNNTEARNAFSFHLLGEGLDSSIRIDSFKVGISR